MIYFLFVLCWYARAERRAFGAEAPKARRSCGRLTSVADVDRADAHVGTDAATGLRA